MPFPSTRVVHPRWSAHHQPVTEDAMNALVTIEFGGTEPTWSSGGVSTEGEAAVTYTGPARITYVPAQAREADAADQEVALRRVDVALPREASPQQVDARVRVDAVNGNGPAWLVGRVLTVASLGRSSHAWEQLLECVDDLANQESS